MPDQYQHGFSNPWWSSSSTAAAGKSSKATECKAKSRLSWDLFCAARQGNAGDVDRIIKNGGNDVDVNVRVAFDTEWSTPLHQAVRSRCIDAVAVLVAAGSELDQPDAVKRTALHYAVEYARPDMVAFLLKQGANTNFRDEEGKTPLMHAAKLQDPDIVSMLLEADPSTINQSCHLGMETALSIACTYGSAVSVELLSQHPLSLVRHPNDHVSLISHTIQSFGTAKKDKIESLIKALKMKEGSEGLRREMMTLSPVADTLVNVSTPLTCLAGINNLHGDNIELMEMLIDNGCDVDLPASTGLKPPSGGLHSMTAGQTPLHKSIIRGDADSVRLLLLAGCKLPSNSRAFTAAAMRSSAGDTKVLRLLLASGQQPFLSCSTVPSEEVTKLLRKHSTTPRSLLYLARMAWIRAPRQQTGLDRMRQMRDTRELPAELKPFMLLLEDEEF